MLLEPLKDILIVTNSADPHADAVISKLANPNRAFRINTEGILSDWHFHYDGARCTMSDPIGATLRTDQVQSVWYRRPERPAPPNLGNDDLANVVTEEAWHGLYHALHAMTQARWMGHPLRDKTASSRVAQLQCAQSIGWTTPPTCIARDGDVVRAFAEQHEELVVKPLGRKGLTSEGQWTPYFSERISRKALLEQDVSVLESTYNYLQAYVPKRREWRVTVVGDRIFPCIVDSQNTIGAESDWRRVRHTSIQHEAGTLPEAMGDQLLTYLKRFDLPYGAFDFIEDPEGEFHFLECNANGQWLWIEEHTGMPIAQAIADWLEST